uniref:Uncharacterized protein n=1 Tax=Arundo donax TaxID=35708 RepID=A0A0A9FN53_ARUDO
MLCYYAELSSGILSHGSCNLYIWYSYELVGLFCGSGIY